ncbi:hypothetical protein P152DRAFT_80719 [Eremomyces bilateralis CBS 781.70]|uniref:Uncharacterized protein n=1 Tax=Eremomyces bilateralis CBS 781.70 TaxID=1392243 RepID=A0A6G1FY15_9PEZI|nr:uncharacterized protein P152DRAFT_80719 [Eremomyces bilateralis CBS 781.70]KAF1810727.1 hypothetical protein P152DRAFT_80719 [Eremomyces bilateralis CBS 781.70]
MPPKPKKTKKGKKGDDDDKVSHDELISKLEKVELAEKESYNLMLQYIDEGHDTIEGKKGDSYHKAMTKAKTVTSNARDQYAEAYGMWAAQQSPGTITPAQTEALWARIRKRGYSELSFNVKATQKAIDQLTQAGLKDQCTRPFEELVELGQIAAIHVLKDMQRDGLLPAGLAPDADPTSPAGVSARIIADLAAAQEAAETKFESANAAQATTSKTSNTNAAIAKTSNNKTTSANSKNKMETSASNTKNKTDTIAANTKGTKAKNFNAKKATNNGTAIESTSSVTNEPPSATTEEPYNPQRVVVMAKVHLAQLQDLVVQAKEINASLDKALARYEEHKKEDTEENKRERGQVQRH